MIKSPIIIALIISVSSCYAHATAPNTLNPFTTDGCSLFPDGSLSNDSLWLHCCRAHDFDYWQGGTQSQRVASDKRLQHCVEQVSPFGLGVMMYLGVRIGGSPMWPTSFRWGYGWNASREYSPISAIERQQIDRQIALWCQQSDDTICLK